MASETQPRRFREAFIRRTGGASESFERRVFLHCVPPLQRPLAWLLSELIPRLFLPDFTALSEAAEATSTDEVWRMAGEFRGNSRYGSNPIRDWLGVRVSGRRLAAIAEEVLGPRTDNRPLPSAPVSGHRVTPMAADQSQETLAPRCPA
jgi:hypothetical protein